MKVQRAPLELTSYEVCSDQPGSTAASDGSPLLSAAGCLELSMQLSTG